MYCKLFCHENSERDVFRFAFYFILSRRLYPIYIYTFKLLVYNEILLLYCWCPLTTWWAKRDKHSTRTQSLCVSSAPVRGKAMTRRRVKQRNILPKIRTLGLVALSKWKNLLDIKHNILFLVKFGEQLISLRNFFDPETRSRSVFFFHIIYLLICQGCNTVTRTTARSLFLRLFVCRSYLLQTYISISIFFFYIIIDIVGYVYDRNENISVQQNKLT